LLTLSDLLYLADNILFRKTMNGNPCIHQLLRPTNVFPHKTQSHFVCFCSPTESLLFVQIVFCLSLGIYPTMYNDTLFNSYILVLTVHVPMPFICWLTKRFTCLLTKVSNKLLKIFPLSQIQAHTKIKT